MKNIIENFLNDNLFQKLLPDDVLGGAGLVGEA